MILKWILKSVVEKCGLSSTDSGYGPVATCCKHDNELSVSMKGTKFFYQLSKYQFLKKESAARSLV